MYNYLILSSLCGGVILSRQNTLQYLCVYRRANISVFQALVFVLFMFLSFCICCGKNAGKAPISLKNGYQMIVFSTKRAFIEYKIDTISP